MSWTKAVYSSMVSEVSWDEKTGEMIVTWARSGKRSAYKGVTEDLAIEVSNAASVGQFINSEIKPYFGHRYV